MCLPACRVSASAAHPPPPSEHSLVDFLDRVRKYFKLPLAVGFGLSTRAHVTSVGKLAEGAIMGSAIVRAIRAGGDTTEERCASVAKFIASVLKD